MVAAYRSHTTANSGSGGYNISRPAGVTSGDVLVLVVFTDTGNATDIGTPSGWTLAASQNSGQEYTRGRVFVKTAGSEPSSYSLSHNGSSSVAILVAVQDATLPGVYAAVSSGSGNNVTSPSVTPSSASGLEIRFAGADGDGNNRTFTPPSTYTEFADLRNQSFTHAQGVYKVLASASATGNQNHLASGSIVSRLGFTVFVPSAVTSVDATAEPDVVQAAASIPTPGVAADFGSTATPPTVAATASIPAPDVDDGSAPPEPPALVGSVTTAADRLATLTVAKPTGVQAGDLLIAHQTSDVSDLADLTTPTGGATWQLLDQFEEAGALQVKVWWKIAGESEPSSWDFSQESFADGAVLIAAFRNAADDTPTVANTSTASTASVPTPGITPPSPASVEIRIASGNSAGNTVSWTPPAGLEEKADVQSTNYVAATLATRDLDSTTPTGTENFTASAALEFAAGFTIGIAGAGTSTVDATATPALVEAHASIPAPAVQADTGATATPPAVAATASIPAPDVSTGGGSAEPPSLVGSVTTAAGGTSALICDKPAGVQAGDLLIAYQSSDVSELADLTTPTGGATWLLLDAHDVEFTHQVKVWWKIAGASEPSDWTFTQGDGADGTVMVAAFRDADDATPVFDVLETPADTTASTPGITPPSAASMEIRIASASTLGDTVSWTPPAGFDEQADIQSSVYVSSTLATRELDSASPTGIEDFVLSHAFGYAFGYTIAIGGVGASNVDATATPSAVQASTTVSAPTVSAGATATATPVQTAASVPAPTPAVEATATGGTVTAAATVPAPGVSASALASPTTVQATTALPSPSVSASSTAATEAVQATTTIPAPTVAAGASATPPTAAAAASIPAPAASASSTAVPGTVAATATVPEPAVTAVTAASPDTVQAAATIPTPSATAGATASTVVVEATASIPAPSIAASATVTPGVVSATTTIPAPSTSAGSTATPGAVEAPASIPEPVVSAGSTAAPDTVEAGVSIPAPSVATGLVASAQTVQATASIPAPTVSYGQTAAPAVVAASASIPSPAVQSGSSSTATATTVQATASIPEPSGSAGAVAHAAVVAAEASTPAPVASGSSTASPGAVEAHASIPAPSLSAGVTATPSTVQATADIPAPTVEADGNATAQPGAVRAAASIPAPSAGASSTATPAVVLATAAVPTPAATVLVAATPQVVEAYATIPAALVHATARPPTLRAVATIPTPAVSTGDLPQQIDIKVGPPTRWWSAGNPGRTWQAGGPSRRWSAGAPTR